jgi:hypothetical protein
MKHRSTFSTLVLVCAISSSACGMLSHSGSLGGPAHQEDTGSLTERTLYGLVQSLDNHGRRAGSLPTSLASVLGGDRQQVLDSWKHEIRYRSSGLRFELRSAGADGAIETVDDIVATGQVGRNRPCELRNGSLVVRWEEFAPPCTPAGPVTVLPLCPGLLRADLGSNPGTSQLDSVDVVGRQLVGVARRIDGASREVGGLIPTLRPVLGSKPLGNYWGFTDVWGNAIHYSRFGDAFELRSAGRDRTLNTTDDVAVRSTVGQIQLCEFHIGQSQQICGTLPPPC